MRARRVVRESASSPREVLYRAYVAVILALVFGVPLIQGLASVARGIVAENGAAPLLWSARVVVGVVLALTAVAPSHLGPVLASETELYYLIEGPFGVRPVVLGRTWTILGSTVVLVGAIAGTLEAGMGIGWGPGLSGIGWFLGATVLVGVSLLGTQTRWAAPTRMAALLSGCGIVVVSILARRDGWPLLGGADLWGTGVLVSAGVVGLAVVPLLLGGVADRTLEHDARLRKMIRSGLVAGDSRVLGLHEGVPVRRFRGHAIRIGGGVWRRSMSVDAISALRRPERTAAALAILIVTGIALARGWAPVLVVPVGLVVVSVAFSVLAQGLSGVLDSLGAGRLDPSGFAVTVLAHCAVPWVATTLALGTGAGIGAAIDGGVGVAMVLVLVAAPCTAIALMGASTAPVLVLDASGGATGEFGSSLLIAWLGRGLLPALVAAALLVVLPGGAGIAASATLLIPSCAIAALVHLWGLRKTDAWARGVSGGRDRKRNP